MILDDIIAFFGSIIQGIVLLFTSIINAILFLIEWLVGLVVDGFTIGRVGKKRKEDEEQKDVAGAAIGKAIGVILPLVIGIAIAFLPNSLKREITLVAEDGHSLPFAAVIIETKNDTEHLRTDSAGNFTIPRFGEITVTVKDSRYVEKSWARSEIEDELVLERTVLGSALDIISDKLLKPAKK